MTGRARITFRFDRADPRLPGKERPSGGERPAGGNPRSLAETRHTGRGPLLQDDVDQLERLIRGEDPQVVPLRPGADKPAGGTPPVPGDSGNPGTVSGVVHASGTASAPPSADHDPRRAVSETSGSLTGPLTSAFRDTSGIPNGISGSSSGTPCGISGTATGALDGVSASASVPLNGASVSASGDRNIPFAGGFGTRSGTSAAESGTLIDVFDAVSGISGDPSGTANSRRPELAVKPGREGVPPPSGIRVFLAVAGAIATGAVFGYLLLWLIAGQPWVSGSGHVAESPRQQSSAVRSVGMDKPSGQEAGEEKAAGNPGTGVPDTAASAPAEDPGRPSAEAVRTPGGAGTETLAVPADLFYFLQYGVFSSEARMKEALVTVRNKGLAAVAAQNDGYRVFVGAAATRDDAERLAKLLGDLKVYIKVLDNPPLVLPADGLPAGLPDFFERSGHLARQLARRSLVILNEGGPPPEEDWERLEDHHRQWRQAAQSLEADPALTGDMQTLALRAAGRLDEAVARLEEGRSGQDRNALWDVQSATMEALIDLTRLRDTLRIGGTATEAQENASG